MISTVEDYLIQLRSALSGADPALIQDALYDAEEYLRSATADSGDSPDSVAAAIEDYGTPQEVADAYREAEITVAAALRKPAPARPDTTLGRSPLGRFFGVVADPSAWGSLFYLVLALATGIVYFTLVVTGVSLTAGTIVLIIGIPLALLFLAVVRAVSFAEGRVVEGLLGVRMPRRPRIVATGDGNLWSRIKAWLTDYRTWTTMLYMLLQLPLGIAYFTLVITGLSTAAGLVAAPFVQVIFERPVFTWGPYGYYIEWYGMPFVIAGGLLAFVLTLWIAKGIGIAHGAYAKALLVGRIDQPGEAQAMTAAGAGAPVERG